MSFAPSLPASSRPRRASSRAGASSPASRRTADEAETAGGLEAPVAGGPRAVERLAEERLRLLGAPAPPLQLAEGDEARVDPARVADGAGGFERAPEVLLGGGDVAELEVEERELLERLDPLALQSPRPRSARGPSRTSSSPSLWRPSRRGASPCP